MLREQFWRNPVSSQQQKCGRTENRVRFAGLGCFSLAEFGCCVNERKQRVAGPTNGPIKRIQALKRTVNYRLPCWLDGCGGAFGRRGRPARRWTANYFLQTATLLSIGACHYSVARFSGPIVENFPEVRRLRRGVQSVVSSRRGESGFSAIRMWADFFAIS